MKHTSRKKMLLSSIAMLLVAMLALGSATFAWFTTNPNANATGLTLKATAAKGLEIQTATHNAVNPDFWGHTDYLNCNASGTASKTDSIELTPASFNYAIADTLGACYTVEAAADDAAAAKSDADVVDGLAGVYQEEIACKLTGATDVSDTATLKMNGLSISTTSAAQKDGIRVAIEYNGKLIGVYAPTARTNDYLNGTIDSQFSTFTTTSKTFPVYSGTTELGQVKTDGTDKVKVTVYLDGEDSTVYSRNISASDLVTNINVSLTIR